MNVNNVRFVCTAVKPSQYPLDQKPEVAFVGRSNVGKSSLINYLLNRKALAKVSSSPGKTRGINFFDVEEELYFVDLPGYGYAKISKQEKESWSVMINSYLEQSAHLEAIILLLDIRREPSELDKIMLQWITDSNKNFTVVATKSDKVAKSDIHGRIENIKNVLELKDDIDVIPVSSEKKYGREEVWRFIQEHMEIIN